MCINGTWNCSASTFNSFNRKELVMRYRISTDLASNRYLVEERKGNKWHIIATLKSWREAWTIVWNTVKG